MRKAIAIDFDGCLCDEAWPEIGAPHMSVIQAAIREKECGTALILWTCRVGKRLDEAVKFCANLGLTFDAVNANLPERIAAYGLDCRKVNADEYWDDRAIQMPIDQKNDMPTLRRLKNMGDKKFTVQPQIEVNLTQQDIDDIMVTALEEGIAYWCCQVRAKGSYLGKYASDQISRGGSLILHDAESSDEWELTLEKFLNGVKLYFEKGCHVRVEDGRIDVSDIDANDADCIIQFALFGEVQFG